MHCMNLRAVTDFNSLSLSSRLSGSIAKYCSLRSNRIVACSISGQCSGPAQDSNQSSVFSRTETYALLKHQLEVAAKSEDYKEAARLRDCLKLFEDEEPVMRLRRLLKEAINEEYSRMQLGM